MPPINQLAWINEAAAIALPYPVVTEQNLDDESVCSSSKGSMGMYLSRQNTFQNTRRRCSSSVQSLAGEIKLRGFSSEDSRWVSVSTLSCRYSTVRVSDPTFDQALDASP